MLYFKFREMSTWMRSKVREYFDSQNFSIFFYVMLNSHIIKLAYRIVILPVMYEQYGMKFHIGLKDKQKNET